MVLDPVGDLVVKGGHYEVLNLRGSSDLELDLESQKEVGLENVVYGFMRGRSIEEILSSSLRGEVRRGRGGGVGKSSIRLRAPRQPSTPQARWPESGHLDGGFEGWQGNPQLGRNPLPLFYDRKMGEEGKSAPDPAGGSHASPHPSSKVARIQPPRPRGRGPAKKPPKGSGPLPSL
ncbi:hypothetical protein CRG98_002729 [Punica granatum]|uniref:Uncharacterized protein n=1 Tax=Punica granatum TaxID=22663 RepID=A0A2I0L8B2_PUNGR|nr:hypothetical protein CRG98_002729 [Punica granatum]